jgi:hypothetical protein
VATLQARIEEALTEVGNDMQLRPVMCRDFSAAGDLTVRTGKSHVVMLGSGLLIAVDGWLETAATGATTFKVDVNLNDTTIYGTQGNRPIWAASSKTPTVGSHSVTTFADGDRLSVDIDAIGSTLPGSDLTVSVFYLRTA